MTAPAAVVEIGFGSTWQTEPASITWTDLTDYVLVRRGLVTERGASSARGQVDAGQCSLVLDNSDRRFDPTYAAGPHFGELLPGVPIRVRIATGSLTWDGAPLTWDGVDLEWSAGVPLWRGTVARWPQRYDIGNTFAWVPIEAWDGFDKLSRAKIPRSVLEKEILADSPVAYWKLDETSGDLAIDSSGNGYHARYVNGTPALSEEIQSEDLATHRGIQFDGEHAAVTPEPGAAVLARPAVYECVVAPENTINAGRMIYTAGTGNSTGNLAAIYTAVTADGWQAGGQVTGTDAGTYSVNQPLEEGVAHHMALRVPAASDAQMWVDGTNQTLTPFTSGGGLLAKGAIIGSVKYSTARPVNAYIGFVAHLAVYDADIGTTRIAAHAAAALAPLDGQTTDERIAWILDELDWPANLRDFETGQTLLGSATFKPGDGALEYLRLVTASEDGLLFVGADGSLRFLDRYWRFLDTLATTSQFTFTDQDGDQGYAVFDLDLDDELLVNVARFTRRNGTEQIATDPTSVNEYGEAELQQSNLLVQTDNEALSLAEWTVATRSTPLPRVPKIRVPLHRYSEADQATVLGLDLGHRVTCERTPQGIGSAISLDFVIDGIRNEVGEGEWWWEAFVSPAPDTTLTPFRWDVSEWDGDHAWAH